MVLAWSIWCGVRPNSFLNKTKWVFLFASSCLPIQMTSICFLTKEMHLWPIFMINLELNLVDICGNKRLLLDYEIFTFTSTPPYPANHIIQVKGLSFHHSTPPSPDNRRCKCRSQYFVSLPAHSCLGKKWEIDLLQCKKYFNILSQNLPINHTFSDTQGLNYDRVALDIEIFGKITLCWLIVWKFTF